MRAPFPVRCLLPAAVLASCSLAAEFASMEAPEIRAFLPGGEFVLPGEASEITVVFSAGMSASSVEKAFSLEADSRPVEGAFAWSDGQTRLRFTPLAPLPDPASFTAEISRSAEDRHGNSLAADFRRTFHTRREIDRPRVLSAAPGPGSPASPRETVIIRFSEPMEEAGAAAAFSIAPAPAGYFSWEEDGAVLAFHPLQDYAPGGICKVRISSAAADLAGNTLAEDFVFGFTVPGEPWEPAGVEILPGGEIVPETVPGIFLGSHPPVEKDQKFLLRFSGPVPPDDRRYLASVVPPVPFGLSWNPEGDEAVLEFSEPLEWDVVHELRIGGSVRRFIVNGEGSRPPDIGGVFFLPDAAAADPERIELVFAGNCSFAASENAAFDVIVTHGDDAKIVLASFLAAFSVTAEGGCLDVSPGRVETIPAGPGATVFRTHCGISPGPVPGIVTLEIGEELRDERDNLLSRDFVLVINAL